MPPPSGRLRVSRAPMRTVKVEPSGITITVLPGETVMHAANRMGYFWPTICGGNAECGVCRLRLIHGEDTEPVSNAERVKLSQLSHLPGPGRLACQLVPSSDLVVFKPGVRPPP